MSWSLSTQGSPGDARKKVDDNQYVPAEVKQALAQLLTGFAQDKDVQLTTHGHVDPTTKTGNATLTINTV